MHCLPGKFILLDVQHGVFNCFVHKSINTGDEKVDCTKQCLSVLGQKLLGVSVVTKLLLKGQMSQNFNHLAEILNLF